MMSYLKRLGGGAEKVFERLQAGLHAPDLLRGVHERLVVADDLGSQRRLCLEGVVTYRGGVAALLLLVVMVVVVVVVMVVPHDALAGRTSQRGEPSTRFLSGTPDSLHTKRRNTHARAAST